MSEITLEGLLRDILYQMSRAEGQKAVAIANCFIKNYLTEQCFKLPVSRLNELAKADKEERCVILPVKVNDSVWFIKSAFSLAHFPIKANRVALRGLTTDGDVWYTAITEYNHISRSFYGSDLNKTVFLTYKEAEQALKEREQNEKI